MNQENPQYQPDALLSENEIVQQIILGGIKKRYMMNDK